jgi:hypothetical protein
VFPLGLGTPNLSNRPPCIQDFCTDGHDIFHVETDNQASPGGLPNQVSFLFMGQGISLHKGVGGVCSGLMKLDTHLGENARQIEVSDDQTTPFLFC